MTTALIADDEPLLAEHLREKLAVLWPELNIIGQPSNGIDAAAMIAQRKPDIAFLDIKMPGLSGIEVAQAIETDTRIVFVTAYDEFAVAAFDNEAIDYVLKPIADARLTLTVERLKKSLATRAPEPDISKILNLLQQATATTNDTPTLRWIRANRGETTYQIAVDEVIFFQSDDKYTVINTINGEHLISKPLSELARALDREYFWQVHRGTIINIRYVVSTKRDGEGRMAAQLKGYARPVGISRAYQHLFKQN
jgi:DNA-binding LytR/AlgR family response regulator